MNYNALLCTSMKYSEFRTLNMNQYVLVSFPFIPSDIFIQLQSCLEIFRAASKTNLSAVCSVMILYLLNLSFSSSGSISTLQFGQNFYQDKVIPKQDVYIHFVAPNQSKIKENILMVKIEVEKPVSYTHLTLPTICSV